MKIAIVRQRYNPYGGAERFVERATQELSRQGAQVTVVAREWSGSAGAAQWLRCDPLYVGRLWRDAGFARAVCTATQGRFDLVQSHERIDCCDLYRAGDGVHAQWLEHRRHLLGRASRAALKVNAYHRYVLAAERRTFGSPRLRAVICNSAMVRSEVLRWFGLDEQKLHVIYNGVDLDAFHPSLRQAHREAMRDRLGVPQSAPVVLFVGSGFVRKGLPQLLRAMARLEGAHLLVVGRDSAQPQLMRLAERMRIAGRVHWAGGQQDVRPWYGTADVFALPTFYDPFPNAALEALASGLPILTSRNCGAAELVRNGENGCVCGDPADVDDLAESLASLCARSAQLSQAARRAAEPCGLQAMGAALVTLYERLLNG